MFRFIILNALYCNRAESASLWEKLTNSGDKLLEPIPSEGSKVHDFIKSMPLFRGTDSEATVEEDASIFSKVRGWFGDVRGPDASTTTTTTTSTNASKTEESPKKKDKKAEVRSDPRLVPSVIYDMECAPGSAFHMCIQDCNARNKSSNTPRGGTYKETETFKSCVQNCADALLNSPGPGCLTEDGQLITKSPGTVYNPKSVQVKAWLYRLNHSLNIPFGHWISTIIKNIVFFGFWIGVAYLFIQSKVHELLFIVINGLPEGSHAESSAENARWDKAIEVHDLLYLYLDMAQVQWNSVSCYIESASTTLYQYLVVLFNMMMVERDGAIYDSVNQREHDYMKKLNSYDLSVL